MTIDIPSISPHAAAHDALRKALYAKALPSFLRDLLTYVDAYPDLTAFDQSERRISTQRFELLEY